MSASFTFVMPVYNATRTIEAALGSVVEAARQWGHAQVVVADNGSTDGTVQTIESLFGPRVTLLSAPKASISELRNLAVLQSQGQLIAFIDADCVIQSDYCFRAHAVLSQHEVAVVGSPYQTSSPAHWIEKTWTRLHGKFTEGITEWLPGGNLVVRRHVFEQVGGFDPTLRTGEDVDLCRRIRAAGHIIYRHPGLIAVHLGNPRTIGAFLRQHWWHGMGAVAGALRGAVLPFAMAITHFSLTLLSLATFVIAPGLWSLAVMATAQALVPVAAVIYRISRGGRGANVPAAVLLYLLYFWARIAALGSITFGFPRPNRGRR